MIKHPLEAAKRPCNRAAATATEMTMDAIVGVSVFGSREARRFSEEWLAAAGTGDDAAQQSAARRIQDQVRHGLNPEPDQ
jgi:hypothetical protein